MPSIAGFDLDVSGALMNVQGRLVLCGGSVDHEAVFQSEFRSVPGTDDRSVLERPLGERPTEVGTRMGEGADAAMRSEERRVGKECRSRWRPQQRKKAEAEGRD